MLSDLLSNKSNRLVVRRNRSGDSIDKLSYNPNTSVRHCSEKRRYILLRGDCFFFVGKLKGLDCGKGNNFIEILKTINYDMSLGLDNSSSTVCGLQQVYPQGKRTITEPHRTKSYNIIQQPFTQKELDFWEQSGITINILKLYKTVSLKEFKSINRDNKPFTCTSSDKEPIFGYIGKRYVKIYRPFSEIRFLYGGNIGDGYCFGLEQSPLFCFLWGSALCW